jgi:hypothetical protein
MKHLHWGGNEERPEEGEGRHAAEAPEDDYRVRRPRGQGPAKAQANARLAHRAPDRTSTGDLA